MSDYEKVVAAEQRSLDAYLAARGPLLDKVAVAARALLYWSDGGVPNYEKEHLRVAFRALDAHDTAERDRQVARKKLGDMCPQCYGSGTRCPVPSNFNGPCELCNGSGRVKECLNCKYPPPDAFGHVVGHIYMGPGQKWQPCKRCKAKGLVAHDPSTKKEKETA